jgi:hypothetical protein
MTITPPSIQVLHASDAPQHTGELKTILQRLKAEHRIADFSALDITTNPEALLFKNEDHQGIIVLLTNEIERLRNKIENVLKNITSAKQDIKLIEIIVDNLPYHNNFISFPQDLMPIRSRDDMNRVWNGIEEDLKSIFPKLEQPTPEPVPVQKKNPRILLKVFFVAIMMAVLSALYVVQLDDDNEIPDDAINFLAPIVFSFLIPFLIFFRDRKDLESYSLSEQGNKRIDGGFNWKQLLIRSGIAFLLTFLAILFFVSEPSLGNTAVLGVAVVLPLILYRRKTNHSAKNNDEGGEVSSLKKNLKSIGRYLLFFFLGMIYWAIVLATFDEKTDLDVPIVMAVFNTIGIFIIRFLQKRNTPITVTAQNTR